MKHLLRILVLAASVATSADGQAFTNLDFEAAIVAPANPPFGFLDWNLAAPGWSHSSGADSGIVYYGGTHLGLTQWFLLTDSATQPGGVLSGTYSMRFASGHESNSESAPWVNAYLSQTGVIPNDAKSLTLLANGPLGLSINGTSIPLVSLGGPSFAADVSSYSGSAVEIRFTNVSLQIFDAVSIDNIGFSTSPVPEPATWILFCMGAVVAPVCRRARQALKLGR